MENSLVMNLLVENKKIVGIQTAQGDIFCSTVIVSAGAWRSPLISMWDTGPSIRSKAIQIHFLKNESKHFSLPCFIDEITGLYGRMQNKHTLLVGYPTNDWDIHLDKTQMVDDSHLALTYHIGKSRIPALKETIVENVRRSFDGYTQNFRGRIEKIGDIEGLYLSSGWSGGGVK